MDVERTLHRLNSLILAVTPIIGIRSFTAGINASVLVDPPSLQAAAQPTIDAFDWSDAAQIAWEHLQARTQAVAALGVTFGQGNAEALYKLIRAVADASRDSENLLRDAIPHGVTSITRSGTTATAICPVVHLRQSGEQIAIHGADVAAYNGLKTLTVTNATTFTFTVSGSPATPATGSLFWVKGFAVLPQITDAVLRTAIANRVNDGTVDT